MKLQVAAVGQRMPGWVNEAWNEYARRMPPGLGLSLREITLAKRGKNADTKRLTGLESKALFGPRASRVSPISLFRTVTSVLNRFTSGISTSVIVRVSVSRTDIGVLPN